MKFNNILKAIPAFAIGLAFVACTEAFEYTPAEPEDAAKTYVGADLNATRNVDADGSDLVIPFVRNNASGDLDVNIYLDDPSGLFSLASQTIHFASGETTANAIVKYSYDALVPETVYNISVGISSSDLMSEYRPVALPVSCKKAWQDLGMAQFYDDWWTGGPFEKKLLKAPDGTETYRLINPWDKQSVIEGGLDFVSEVPYLEFKIGEDGSISYANILNMGFTYSGMTCHMLHPSVRSDAESAAMNTMVMEDVAQFCWYPVLNYSNGGYSWWVVTSVAYISFPGGPDLNELLQ